MNTCSEDMKRLEEVFATERFNVLNRLVKDRTSCTKNIVNILNDVHANTPFTTIEMYNICNKIAVLFAMEAAMPFSAIGSAAAQSSIEPISQAILKSMHSAGKSFSRAEILDILKGSTNDEFDTVYVHSVCEDRLVAYRHLCHFVKRNPADYIVSKTSTRVTLDARKLVMHNVSVSVLFPEFGLTFVESVVVDGHTHVVYSIPYSKSQEFDLFVIKPGLAGTIEWESAKQRFVLRTEFCRFFDFASEEFICRKSMRTLNIAKIAKKVGILTAGNVMASLLYEIYNFDPNTIESLVGFVCSGGDQVRNMALTNNGIFAALFTGTVPTAAKLSADHTVDNTTASHLLDTIALNQNSTSVGVTAVANKREAAERLAAMVSQFN